MQTNDHQQSLGYLTGLTSRLFNKLITTRFQNAGIDMTAEQWGVIVILMNEESMTQGQIGERLYLEKSSVSRSIDGLEKRGWIERKKSTEDSRKKLVYLTPKSIEIAERCSAIAQNVLEDAQKGLNSEELALSKNLLTGVISNLRIQNNS